ncbi:hypothetical protein M9980_06050 [Sphingomonas donggukensis]|uniref:Uncharacterized protein n=1 Tax=Sphingomonas donggukensis TaxID=2949093 RepID=A0ABY4U1U3_9SPHN|nr:hypothetical protein [Sphingomonas donggukensis]URW76761.1 hypothetical protein M9980_06050 [Sphingomonas donggukensis]
MDERKPTDIDAKDAAKKIEEAGVADETAAYSDAIQDNGRTPASEESAAHPS